MAQKHDAERIAAAFQEAEASVALEGLDPHGPAYDRAKELFIAGKITSAEGIAMLRADAMRDGSIKGAY